MVELRPGVVRAIAAREEGHPEEALAILIGLFARICKDEAFAGKNMFIVMFEWQMLAGEYGPARDALARARDAQARQLLEGDNRLRSGRPYPGIRFQLIAGINDTLQDPHSNAMKAVWLCAATFEGLGRGTEADALRSAALAGIASEEMRALAARELAEPGTIFRELGEHREAQEAHAGHLHLVPNQNPPG